MRREILMPSLSAEMTQGGVARWLKREGETVAAGEAIAEIETDKSTVELEAPADGVLEKILAQAGATDILVDAPIAVLLTATIRDPAVLIEPSQTPATLQVPASSKAAPPPVSAAALPDVAEIRTAASPLARKLAREADLELGTIQGSGPGGRVVKVDIERASAEGTGVAEAPHQPGIPFKARPNSTLRRTIATRLMAAKQTIPHIYLTIDCRLDRLLELRAGLNEASIAWNVSINDLLVYAAGQALVEVPAANASWTDSAILQYERVDVSVAVAAASGLITPIVKNVAARPLRDVSRDLRELVARAREGKLLPAEYQGGTFCVTNLGMYGVRQFGAIINSPQACILALGAAEPRPVVREGSLGIATVMTCTLSADHRVVDGAVGAQLLAAFKRCVEKPLAMIV